MAGVLLMAFRANEEIEQGHKRAYTYLIPPTLRASKETQQRSLAALEEHLPRLGPAVQGYPTWHPIVYRPGHGASQQLPDQGCGYQGLDHTCHFANGFITAPYQDPDAVLDSVKALPAHPAFQILAEPIDAELYATGTQPVVVYCEWANDLLPDGTIPAGTATGLMLESELPAWTRARGPESWQTMRPYLLGHPHGARSSLFINQETGIKLKQVWAAITQAGLFGSLM